MRKQVVVRIAQLAVVPLSAQVPPGGRLFVSLQLRNETQSPVTCRIGIENIPVGWYDLPTPQVSLAPNSEQEVALVVHPPDGARVGHYSFQLNCAGKGVKVSVTQDFYVSPRGAVDVYISSRNDGVPGLFDIVVSNKGEYPTSITLSTNIASPQLAVSVTPADPFIVEGKETGRAVLSVMASRTRGRIPPGIHDIAVHVRQEGEGLSFPILTTRQVHFDATANGRSLAFSSFLRVMPVWAWAIPLLLIAVLLVVRVIAGDNKGQTIHITTATPSAQHAVIGTASPTVPSTSSPVPTNTLSPTAVPNILSLRHSGSGSPYVLIWSMSHGSSNRLNGRHVGSAGRLILPFPIHAGIYRLVSTLASGTIDRVLRVSLGVRSSVSPDGLSIVLARPQISSFYVQVVQHYAVANWVVTGATHVRVLGKLVGANSGVVVPNGVKLLTLVAVNDVGSLQRSLVIPTATHRPIPTATHRPIPTATHRPIPTATHRPIPTATHRPIPTATHRPIPTATFRPIPTATFRPMPTATFRPLPTATPRPIPTATRRPIPTATKKVVPPTPSALPTIVISG